MWVCVVSTASGDLPTAIGRIGGRGSLQVATPVARCRSVGTNRLHPATVRDLPMTFAARTTRPDSPRPAGEVRRTLDSIADEILARLEDVLARPERPADSTVIVSGDAPLSSARDTRGWSTRIEDIANVR